MIGVALLALLTTYSLQTVGQEPWDVEEVFTEPGRFEGEIIVMTHTIRGFNGSGIIQISFSRDDRLLSLPFRFPEDPGLFEGGVLSVRGTCRLSSEGAIVVDDYHVANSRPKVIIGLVAMTFLVIYFLGKYRFIPCEMVWERKGDA